ncbi:MAG: hypothetical protein ABSC20_06800 [Candidatus Bathyarchaeia archaeon]|jgi:hypothetical protein
MKVKVWKLLGLMLIAIFALSAANASATPTMSSMAGTYVEQTSSGTGYTIILYENGTGLFSTYSGTWHIVNSTTFEGIYVILGITQNDYFTITNNGFTAVQTGNVYVKTTSASSSPTASASASPTTSATSTPKVPEFSNAALVSVFAAILVVTLCTVAMRRKNSKKLRN